MIALLSKSGDSTNNLRCVINEFPIELTRDSYVDFDIVGDYKVIAVRGHKKHNIITFTCDVFEDTTQIDNVNKLSVLYELKTSNTPNTFVLSTQYHSYSNFYLFDMKILEIIPIKVVCSSVSLWNNINRIFPDYFCKCEIKLLNIPGS